MEKKSENYLEPEIYRTEAARHFHTALLNYYTNQNNDFNRVISTIKKLKLRDILQTNTHNCNHFHDILHIGLKSSEFAKTYDVFQEFIDNISKKEINMQSVKELLTAKNKFGYTPLHSILKYGNTLILDLYIETLKQYLCPETDDNNYDDYIDFLNKLALDNIITPINLLAKNTNKYLLKNFLQYFEDSTDEKKLQILTQQNREEPNGLHKAILNRNINFIEEYVAELKKLATPREVQDHLLQLTPVKMVKGVLYGSNSIMRSAVESGSLDVVEYIHQVITGTFGQESDWYKNLIGCYDKSLFCSNNTLNEQQLINDYLAKIQSQVKQTKVTVCCSINKNNLFPPPPPPPKPASAGPGFTIRSVKK